MEKDKNEQLAKLEKELNELPEKAQSAIYWMIKNFDSVIELCKNSEMTDEEIERYREKAIEKEDYLTLALLCTTEIYQNRDSEAMEQQN